MCCVSPSNPRNTIQLSAAAKNNRLVVRICAPRSPMMRQPKPPIIAPTNGAKRIIFSMSLPFHHVDVFDRDSATVAEEADQNRQTNRSLGGGNGQNEQREHLTHQIAQIAG